MEERKNNINPVYCKLDVQRGHLVALMGIAEKQNGQSFVVGTAGGAAFSLCNLLIPLINKKTEKATITKLTIVLKNAP
jgi:hypothetical protein